MIRSISPLSRGRGCRGAVATVVLPPARCSMHPIRWPSTCRITSTSRMALWVSDWWPLSHDSSPPSLPSTRGARWGWISQATCTSARRTRSSCGESRSLLLPPHSCLSSTGTVTDWLLCPAPSCSALFCTALYCSCTVLYYAALHCAALHCFALSNHPSVLLDRRYTGWPQVFVPPIGVHSVLVTMIGGSGGLSWPDGDGPASPGGYGAVVDTWLTVTPLSTYYVYVGGKGIESVSNTGCLVSEPCSQGGWNGGGSAARSGGGGGASDIRTSASLHDRLVVAGGAGGGTTNCHTVNAGGNGGTPNSVGTVGCDSHSVTGATQTAGGVSWEGASCPTVGCDGVFGVGGTSGGGGGGGWWGGGSGGGTGGSGGSSYCNAAVCSRTVTSIAESRGHTDGIVAIWYPSSSAPSQLPTNARAPIPVATLAPTPPPHDVALTYRYGPYCTLILGGVCSARRTPVDLNVPAVCAHCGDVCLPCLSVVICLLCSALLCLCIHRKCLSNCPRCGSALFSWIVGSLVGSKCSYLRSASPVCQ
jgi:hypothetical protein